MNKKAYYGQFGGQYVAESLMNTLQELDQAYEEAIHDPEFMKQYHYYLMLAERHRFTMQSVCLQNTVQKFI